MAWPVLLLLFSLAAFVTSQASSDQDFPPPEPYEEVLTSEEETIVAKRALTLLSRLAPIRAILRQQAEERNYDSRLIMPRAGGSDQRRPGPLRWGRRR